MNEHLSIARQAMGAPWDAARSNRVFEAAVRARGARARRQRWTMLACTGAAAVFVLALRSFGAPGAHGSPAPASVDDLGSASQGPVMLSSSDMIADARFDGGREAD